MNTISHAGLTGARWQRSLRLGALSAALGGVALAQDTEFKHLPFIGDFQSFFNREVWWMSVWAIALSILIFIGVSAALFYSVAKFRERKGDTREPAQFHGNNTLEIVLIVVPLIIVTVLSVLTVRTMARINTNEYAKNVGGETVKVEVLSRQFWWNFSYPDIGGFRNGNEMVMPAGRPINALVSSGDVIHGFWSPNVGGQRAAIPGTTTQVFIDNDRPGVYQGNCSQLCGASHANMRYKVIVLPEDQWNTFVTAAREYRAPAPTEGSAEARGYQIFLNGKDGSPSCAGCHRIQGTPANGVSGPDLSFFGSRMTLGAGMWEGQAALDRLKPWLLNSPGLKPGSLMPAYIRESTGEEILTERDLDDLQAYLLTLRLPRQAEYYNRETGKFSVPVR